MLNKNLFIREFAILEERFNRTSSRIIADRYYDTIKHLTNEEYKRAADHIFANDEYWPTPKRFIELANGNTREHAINEWHTLIEACARNNLNPALSPAGIAAMRAIGGWREIAYAEGETKQASLRRAFLEAYDAQTKRLALPDNDPRRLPS